jgi:hypothetical protein
VLDKVKKTINGHEYEVMAFPAKYNYALFLKFSAVVGDGLKSIFSVAETGGMGNLGEGVALVLKALHSNDPKGDLMLEILSQTTRDGKAINSSTFDQFYTGNIKEMMGALTESIKVHFEGFLPIDHLSGLLFKAQPEMVESTEL